MDLIIAEGDNLWFRSSPIGGKKLNDAIAKRFELSAVEAEAVKQKAHASEHARDVFLTLDPVFGEFVTEIKRSLGQFLAIDPQRRVMIKRVILLGETFCLPSLMQYIHNNLKTTVESVGSFSAAAPQDSDVAGLYAGHGLGLVTAYGLALQALDLTRITACLTPSRLEV